MSVCFVWRAETLMVLERAMCQNLAFPPPARAKFCTSPALKQKWWQWANGPNQSQLHVCSSTAGTKHCLKVCRTAATATHLEAEMLQPIGKCYPVLQSPWNTSVTIFLSLRTLKRPAGWRLNVELCVRIPGHPGWTSQAFSRCSEKRLWTYPLFFPWTSVQNFLVCFIRSYNLSIKPV